MIIGHLSALPLTGLPPVLHALLSRPDCSLQALTARDDGRWQPQDAAWFCHIGPAQTQPRAGRHTEYHRQWADIQVVLAGEERIYAGTLPVGSRVMKSESRIFSSLGRLSTAWRSASARETLRFFIPESRTRRCAP